MSWKYAHPEAEGRVKLTDPPGCLPGARYDVTLLHGLGQANRSCPVLQSFTRSPSGSRRGQVCGGSYPGGVFRPAIGALPCGRRSRSVTS
jgi:hypothetical protein